MTLVSRLVRLILPILLVAASSAARADYPLLAKAREFLGGEAVLARVEALRFIGELEVVEQVSTSAAPARLEILFQKPDRQRITATSEARTEVTALDGYDAWSRVSDPKDPTRWQVTLLGPDQIRRLRANTFENLSFYGGAESQGARVEDRGVVTVDGVVCRQFAFIHGADIVFIRSFDLATGRLVLTETDAGAEIREEGELLAGGIRFPKRIVTTSPLPEGGVRTLRITFTEITVNPAIPADTFAVPQLTD